MQHQLGNETKHRRNLVGHTFGGVEVAGHSKRCRAISQAIGEAQQDPCIMNTWVHDGSKDITGADYVGADSVECAVEVVEAVVNAVERAGAYYLAEEIHGGVVHDGHVVGVPDWMKDCVESKVFGIGLESYTVGSNDFYTAYAAKNGACRESGSWHTECRRVARRYCGPCRGSCRLPECRLRAEITGRDARRSHQLHRNKDL